MSREAKQAGPSAFYEKRRSHEMGSGAPKYPALPQVLGSYRKPRKKGGPACFSWFAFRDGPAASAYLRRFH
jgi:hypothetical protein